MKSSLLRNIRYDLVCGCRYNLKKYVVTVLYAILGCILFYVLSHDYQLMFNNSDITLMDYLIYFFKGDRAVNLEEGTIGVPAVFLGLQIIVASMVGYYPFDDIYGYGKQVFIRMEKKTTWWLSKCVWTFFTVLAVYILIYAFIFICCLMTGADISMSYHAGIVEYMNQQYIGLVSDVDIVLHIFVMPLIYSFMISFVQVMMSLLIGPILSFLLVMMYDIIGILIAEKWLFINHSMLLRNKMASGADIRPMEGLMCMFIVSAVCIIIGVFVIKKKEIFDK